MSFINKTHLKTWQDAVPFADKMVAYDNNTGCQGNFGYVSQAVEKWATHPLSLGFSLSRVFPKEKVPSNCALTTKNLEKDPVFMRLATSSEILDIFNRIYRGELFISEKTSDMALLNRICSLNEFNPTSLMKDLKIDNESQMQRMIKTVNQISTEDNFRIDPNNNEMFYALLLSMKISSFSPLKFIQNHSWNKEQLPYLLFNAIYHNKTDAIGYLQQKIAENYEKFSLLTFAARNRQAHMVSVVLESGKFDFDIDALDDKGCAPLHCAVENGDMAMTDLFLKKGANPNNREEYSHDTALHSAAAKGYTELVNLLIGYGVSIEDQSNWRKWSPLHYAVENCYQNTVKCLLANGANPNSVDSYGQTPLHLAAKSCDQEIVKSLFANGANPDSTDIYGQTPFIPRELQKSQSTEA